ncbi:hypothetical protein ACYSNM_13305 [Myroides sp. LJL116]
MHKLTTYLLIGVLFLSCQQRNVHKIKDNPIVEHKQSTITKRYCLTTITGNKICNLDQKLIGQVIYIGKTNIAFKATQELFRNKVGIVKPNPISHDINDYINLKYLFSPIDYLKIMGIKTSYPLYQTVDRIAVRSYTPLDLDPQGKYIFEADCFTLKTLSESKSIIIIKNVTEAQ